MVSYYKASVVKISAFLSPTERFGGYSDEPGIRQSSVHPSVNIFVSTL